jgi:hypothetical protein
MSPDSHGRFDMPSNLSQSLKALQNLSKAMAESTNALLDGLNQSSERD